MRAASRIFAVALLLAAMPVRAVTTCTMNDLALSLGTYEAMSTVPLDSLGSLSISCYRDGGPPTTSVTVALGPSTTSGSVNPRRLQQNAGPDTLNYNLYRDATRLAIWGDSAGVNTVTRSITLSNKTGGSLNFPIYGRILANQDIRAGMYSDSLLMSVMP